MKIETEKKYQLEEWELFLNDRMQNALIKRKGRMLIIKKGGVQISFSADNNLVLLNEKPPLAFLLLGIIPGAFGVVYFENTLWKFVFMFACIFLVGYLYKIINAANLNTLMQEVAEVIKKG